MELAAVVVAAGGAPVAGQSARRQVLCMLNIVTGVFVEHANAITKADADNMARPHGACGGVRAWVQYDASARKGRPGSPLRLPR